MPRFCACTWSWPKFIDPYYSYICFICRVAWKTGWAKEREAQGRCCIIPGHGQVKQAQQHMKTSSTFLWHICTCASGQCVVRHVWIFRLNICYVCHMLLCECETRMDICFLLSTSICAGLWYSDLIFAMFVICYFVSVRHVLVCVALLPIFVLPFLIWSIWSWPKTGPNRPKTEYRKTEKTDYNSDSVSRWPKRPDQANRTAGVRSNKLILSGSR